MIKSELIDKIAECMTDIPEKKIADSVNFILNMMTESLVNGNRIEVRGFGSFSLHLHPPRQAHNPKTGEKLITKSKFSPHFKPGKELRDRVNALRDSYEIKE